jgi:hypothetical protein
MKSSTVSADLELRCVFPQRVIAPVAASLYYSSEDPYAIRIAFHVGGDEPIEWIFARDLLSMGMMGREGICDVRVWPSVSSDGGSPGSVMNIGLYSPYGQAHFEAPVMKISDFVRRTYQIVPPGEESNHLDVDSELTDLLRREA